MRIFADHLGASPRLAAQDLSYFPEQKETKLRQGLFR
jgi:hypothetical protein